MTQIKLNESIVLDNATIRDYLEYSEYPEKLQTLIDDLQITFTPKEYATYFNNDKDKRVRAEVKITRGYTSIVFDYGMSINDSEIIMLKPSDSKFINGGHVGKQYFTSRMNVSKHKTKKIAKIVKGLLYDVLTCCAIEYHVSIDYSEFCADFGYSTDSIKAKDTWEKCLSQSAKLQRVFESKEIECLPS